MARGKGRETFFVSLCPQRCTLLLSHGRRVGSVEGDCIFAVVYYAPSFPAAAATTKKALLAWLSSARDLPVLYTHMCQ